VYRNGNSFMLSNDNGYRFINYCLNLRKEQNEKKGTTRRISDIT